MNVMIIGCGRVGSRLALHLQRVGNEVTVVDDDREAFNRLGGTFQGTSTQGSGLDQDVLRRGSIAQMDVVVAVTGGDNRNLMIAQLAKHVFGIERTIARLKDPIRAAKYRELGIETLCVTTVVEGLFEHWIQQNEYPVLPGEMSACGDASELYE
jgi:trk system potassium uptake protein TrkA